jgi:FtsP/CotA-like multicopper oxidase with cupredoxin domain
MMKRYGMVLLVNGETQPSFAVTRGEVVRLYLTNTAHTRVFNVAITRAVLKLVDGDSGRYEPGDSVDTVMLAPSESAIVDVLFGTPGDALLEHRTPNHAQPLARFTVGADPTRTSVADADRQPHTDLQHR